MLLWILFGQIHTLWCLTIKGYKYINVLSKGFKVLIFNFDLLWCFFEFPFGQILYLWCLTSKDVNISKSYQRVSKFPIFNFHCLLGATRRASCFVHSGALASRFRAAKIRHPSCGERISVRFFSKISERPPKAFRRVTEGRQEKYKETRDKYQVTKELSTKYKSTKNTESTKSVRCQLFQEKRQLFPYK